jgi:hypothetical protein
MMKASPLKEWPEMRSPSLTFAAAGGETSLHEAAARVAVSLALLSWLGVIVGLFWR